MSIKKVTIRFSRGVWILNDTVYSVKELIKHVNDNELVIENDICLTYEYRKQLWYNDSI